MSNTDDAPVANADSAATAEETLVTIDAAANDTDPDANLDSATANTTCANGSTGCADPGDGILVNNADGTFDYTPNLNFAGDDSFVYEICDTTTPTPLCATATVTITVSNTDDAPVANADTAGTAEETLVTIDVAANDTDPDANLEPATANTTCANGSTGCAGPANGALINNGDGTFDSGWACSQRCRRRY